MGRVKQRKIPVTGKASSARLEATPKPKSTRTLIRRFHVLLKRRASMLADRLRDGTRAGPSSTSQLQAIDAEIAEMGGLERYQQMSAAGQSNERGGGSEKVLIQWLKEMGLHQLNGVGGKGKQKMEGAPTDEKLLLLEVGALKPDNYALCSSWVQCTPMDLRSRHPSIQEQDFLLMDEMANKEKWNIISLSLVVNFVPDPKDRGKMLKLANTFLRRVEGSPRSGPSDSSGYGSVGGVLYLVLPLPCVQNSRYLTREALHEMMSAIGFTLLQERWKVGGKVGYWLYRAEHPPNEKQMTKFTKKIILRDGGNRNNFSIIL